MDSSCNKMINILVHASFICPTMICLSSVYLHVLSHAAVEAVWKKQLNIFSYQTSKKEPFKFRPRPIFFYLERLLNKLAQLKKNYNILVCTCTWHSSDLLSLFQNSFLKKRKTCTLCVEQVWYYVCNCSVVVA